MYFLIIETDNIPDFIEKDRKKTNEIVRKQQLEINQLHTLCCNLKKVTFKFKCYDY